MRYLIFFLMTVGCWGQTPMAVSWAGLGSSSTLTVNTNNISHGNTFVADAATSVSEYALYSSARATANVDSLIAEVFEVFGATVGATVTYADASDIVNLNNNGLSNGDRVKFVAATSLPAGISIDAVYYVCSASANSIQIDDDAGCGSIVTDFSGSSGTQTMAKWIASSTTFSPAPVTSATWVDFSSFSSHTLVAGRKYVVIFRNTEAVPGTDSITIQYSAGDAPSFQPYWANSSPGGFSANNALRGFSSGFGAPWTGYVTLANGSKFGSSVITTAANSNLRVNGTREIGVRFSTPSNIRYNVDWIALQSRLAVGSTFPRQVVLKLYSVGGSTDTLLDSCTASVFITSFNYSMSCPLATTQALTPSTVYRVVALANAPSGDSSNYLAIASSPFRASEAWSNPLSALATYCASSCTTTANWTDIAGETLMFALFLNQATPYASQGGGSAGGSFVVAQ